MWHFFLKKSRYKSAKKPATADLPKVINSADSSLLSEPNAILVATGVSENINMPTNPYINPLFSLLKFRKKLLKGISQ